MKHQPTQLREVSAVRTVGFCDAVADLGTHRMCGRDVPYSKSQVYAVLQGRHASRRLLERIAERRPDLFTLRFVADSVREFHAGYLAERGGGEAAQ